MRVVAVYHEDRTIVRPPLCVFSELRVICPDICPVPPDGGVFRAHASGAPSLRSSSQKSTCSGLGFRIGRNQEVEVNWALPQNAHAFVRIKERLRVSGSGEFSGSGSFTVFTAAQ